MPRTSPALTLVICTSLFWALFAGVLPYPTLVVLGLGGGISGFFLALQQCAPWLFVSALVAGTAGTLFTLPLVRRPALDGPAALALWTLASVLAGVLGTLAGVAFQGWQSALAQNQPYALNSAGLQFAAIVFGLGFVPLVLLGLVSYPAFSRLRRRLYRRAPGRGEARA